MPCRLRENNGRWTIFSKLAGDRAAAVREADEGTPNHSGMLTADISTETTAARVTNDYQDDPPGKADKESPRRGTQRGQLAHTRELGSAKQRGQPGRRQSPRGACCSLQPDPASLRET